MVDMEPDEFYQGEPDTSPPVKMNEYICSVLPLNSKCWLLFA